MVQQGAGTPEKPPRLPVTVVTGFAGAGKSALIERWLRECPPGERWALLGNASMSDSPSAVGRYRVAGGCACCTAQASARSALVVLLRAGPWQRLIVELDGTARPEALVDLLRRPPFDALLEVDRLVAVIDATRPAPFEAEPMHPLARAQVEVATRIMVNRTNCLTETRRAALVRRLAVAPPFGRVVELSSAVGYEASGAGSSRGAGATDGVSEAGGDVAPGVAPPDHWRCPANQVFGRTRLQTFAADWPSRHRLAQATGVFRTLRDWYLWHFDGSASRWEACAYRLENRLQWTFAADISAQACAATVTSINADLGQAVDHGNDEA